MTEPLRSDTLPWNRGNAVPNEKIRENITVNLGRDVSRIATLPAHNGVFAFVGGGPSLAGSLDALRERAGARDYMVFTSGKTLGYLTDNGVTPWAWINVDPKPKMVNYVGAEPPAIRYFLSSVSDPSLFDHLKSRDVWMFHTPCAADDSGLYPEGEPLISGGCTTPVRAITLAYVLGYRAIEFWGVDSSFETDLYAYPKNVPQQIVSAETDDGREFASTPVLLMQAEEMDVLVSQWLAHDPSLRFDFHGDGLIQHLMRLFNKEKDNGDHAR